MNQPPQFSPVPPHESQSVPPTPSQRSSIIGAFLISCAIVIAGALGGLLAWHPWDKPEPDLKPRTFSQPILDPETYRTESELWCVQVSTGVSCVAIPGTHRAGPITN